MNNENNIEKKIWTSPELYALDFNETEGGFEQDIEDYAGSPDMSL
jgi:hypothetical protein